MDIEITIPVIPSGITIAIVFVFLLFRSWILGVLVRAWKLVSNTSADLVYGHFEREFAYRALARRYCKAVLADRVETEVEIPSTGRRVPVGEIYVDLKLVVPNEANADESPALRIVGEPGSGKSTYLKFQLVKNCDLLLRPFFQRRARLPVMVRLADSRALASLPKESDRSVSDTTDELMAELASSVEGKLREFEKGVFAHFLGARGVLILLDGLDEVEQSTIPFVSEVIADLARRLRDSPADNRLLVTMRKQAERITDDQLRGEIPQVGRLEAFTGNDIFEYLWKWPWSKDALDRFGIGDDDRGGAAHLAAVATRVFRNLEGQPTLRKLCSNPLVLAMYIMAYEDGIRGSIVESKVDFFRMVSDELLFDRRLSTRNSVPGSRRLELRRLRETLGAAAAAHLDDKEQPYNVISVVDLEAALSVHFSDPTRALKDIELYTGILDYHGPDHMAFVHGVFLDYFAARWYKNNEREAWLRPAREERRLQRLELAGGRNSGVIAFGCAFATRMNQERALDYIQQYLPDLLGIALIETRRYDLDERLSFYLDESRELLENVSDRADFFGVWPEFEILSHILLDLYWNGEKFPTVNLDVKAYAHDVRNSGPFGFGELIEAIIELDASIALSFASLLDRDIEVYHPEHIVEACRDYYVASSMIDEFRRASHATDQIKYAVILCEASLRFPAVGFLLSRLPRTDDQIPWWRLISRRTSRTHEGSGIRPSLLTQVLRIGTNADEAAWFDGMFPEKLEFLKAARLRPFPNRYWLGHRSIWLVLIAGLSAVSLGVAALLGSAFGLQGGPPTAIVLVLIGLVLVAYSLMIAVRVKLFRLIHEPFRDDDYLHPFGRRSWMVRGTALVTHFRYRSLASLVVALDREPFSSVLESPETDTI